MGAGLSFPQQSPMFGGGPLFGGSPWGPAGSIQSNDPIAMGNGGWGGPAGSIQSNDPRAQRNRGIGPPESSTWGINPRAFPGRQLGGIYPGVARGPGGTRFEMNEYLRRHRQPRPGSTT